MASLLITLPNIGQTFQVAAWFEGNPDHIQFFLLSMIIIFSSSFLDLERPSEAERAQLTYARALHRYLR